MTDLTSLRDWRFEIDKQGIAWATLDREGESQNSLSRRVLEELGAIVERTEVGARDKSIRGLVIQSGKDKGFIVGADVREFETITSEQQVIDNVGTVNEMLNRLEKLPIPSKHTIELTAFVASEEIDPVYYEKSYHVEPEEMGRKPFALLVKALEEKKLNAVGKDRIEVKNATGKARPDQLKVTVGFNAGFFVEAEISYAGPGAMNRGDLARSILIERFKNLFNYADPIRVDLIGVDSVHLTAIKREARTEDVRVRIAMRTRNREHAERVAEEIECMGITGPAGGGGFRSTIVPSVATHSTYVDRDKVKYQLTMLQS